MYESYNEEVIDVTDAKRGDKVAVWGVRGPSRGCGQGGTFAAINGDDVVIQAPLGAITYPLAKFTAGELEIYREVIVPMSECIEHEEGVCGGDAPRPFSPRGLGGPMRCGVHIDQRLNRYESSIERYADSASAPSWFDPSACGESWDED